MAGPRLSDHIEPCSIFIKVRFVHNIFLSVIVEFLVFHADLGERRHGFRNERIAAYDGSLPNDGIPS